MPSRRNTVDRRDLSERRERRASGETIPFDVEELERLRTQSSAATPPIVDDEGVEITISSDDPAPRKHAPRAATVSDPMTMSILAEIERIDHEAEAEPEPAPAPRDSNRHIKPRG